MCARTGKRKIYRKPGVESQRSRSLVVNVVNCFTVAENKTQVNSN